VEWVGGNIFKDVSDVLDERDRFVLVLEVRLEFWPEELAGT
jgi:hypothetical protein